MAFNLPNTIQNNASRDARPVQANFAAITEALNNDFVAVDGSIPMSGDLMLSGAPTQAAHAANKGYVDSAIPIGVILPYGGDSPPNAGWLLAQGQLVNKSTWPQLWEVFGANYGTATDTQFRLPDLRSRFPVGKGTATWSDALGEAGGSKDSIIVAHQHTMAHTHTFSATSGAAGTHTHNLPVGWAPVIGGFPPGGLAGAGTQSGASVSGSGNLIAAPNHTHSVSGTTGASSAANTGSQGESGVDKNLPPYITLNYIIRAG